MTTIVKTPPGGGGAFAYGKYGFMYKKKAGGGGRRSTRYIPGGGAITNQATYLYNKYKPGESYIGSQPTAIRRAKNRKASICSPNNNSNCGPFYNTLGRSILLPNGKSSNYPNVYPIFPTSNFPVDEDLYM